MKQTKRERTVLVSGCFDMLHSGHIAFLEGAARLGRVVVALGSDATIAELKGRRPVYSQDERRYMLSALKSVEDVLVADGRGVLDFDSELDEIRPDVFVVNTDGHCARKERLCNDLDIEYIVLDRTPAAGLRPRSTSALRQAEQIPYRIEIAGGWLDQPCVSRHHCGPVVVASIEPDRDFECHCGLATSTRRAARDLWGERIPFGDLHDLAQVLFCFENPPGTHDISGSQDALGLILPGINRLNYDGAYWPSATESIADPETISWLQSHMFLSQLGVRRPDFQVTEQANITAFEVRRLATAADAAWRAIKKHDIAALGRAANENLEAQSQLFPRMVTDEMTVKLNGLRQHAFGVKMTGAGGGGYAIVFADQPPDGALRVTIRTAHDG